MDRDQGREPALAGPNHAMFFNRGDVFRRRRFNGHGDRNHFMVVSDADDGGVAGGARFPDQIGKLLPRPYLTARAIARLAPATAPTAWPSRSCCCGSGTPP